jgi:phosphatidylethanolamine-binding protein (PEBP) family uncharacterized protein
MKNAKISHYLSLCLATMLFASPTTHAGEFKIEFSWDSEMKRCFSSISPEIKLFNVPADTKTLSVSMKDRQSSYRHGGGKFAYNGESAIPAGALQYWEGPCPPLPQSHTYVFTVKTKGGAKEKASFEQDFKQ